MIFSELNNFILVVHDYANEKLFKGNGKIVCDCKNIIVNLKGCGKWENNIAFTFSYRFSFNTDTIEIEHTRYGEAQSAYLCKLNRITPQKFKSDTPHICNEDLYNAELVLKGQSVILSWKIKGPRKNMFLEYTFLN